MVDSIETCRDYRATIPLFTLKIANLCDFPSRFYESLNGKNRMCELSMFSQIRSHIHPKQKQSGCKKREWPSKVKSKLNKN